MIYLRTIKIKFSDICVDDNEWHHIAYTYDGSSTADGANNSNVFNIPRNCICVL